MTKAFKILRTVIVAIATLLFAAVILIQVPSVQTRLTSMVVGMLEENFGGKIEFSSVHLRPFNAIVIKDLVLTDDSPCEIDGEKLDTIARVRSAVATFSLKGLAAKEGILIRRLSVRHGYLAVVTDAKHSTNIKRFISPEPSEKKEKSGETKEQGKVLDIRKVTVSDFRFRLINLRKGRVTRDYGMNFRDLDLTVNKLQAHGIKMEGGYLYAVLDQLSLNEKSGYSISSLSGSTRVGHGQTLIENVRLKDSWSDIRIEEFSMGYDGNPALLDFTDAVRMTAVVKDSDLSTKTMSYFARALKDKDFCFHLKNVDFEGTVDEISLNEFSFEETACGISGMLSARLSGLPEVSGANELTVVVEDLGLTAKGVEKAIKAVSPASKVNLDRFTQTGKILFNGKLSGPLRNLKFTGDVQTVAGSADAELAIRNLAVKGKAIEIGGSFGTHGLDIGKVAGIAQLGECTLHGAMGGTLGTGKTSITLDTLHVSSLNALGYEYSGIHAAGTFSDKAFDGRIVCSDPNLNLLFQGIVSLSDKTGNGLFKFFANIGYADLNALHLDNRGASKVSGQINANYITIGRKDAIGDLDVSSLRLENADGRYDIGDIKISSHANDDINRINLDSRFADASFIGSGPVSSFPDNILRLLIGQELPALLKDSGKSWDPEEYSLSLDVHDAKDLLAFVKPGLYIADSTRLRLNAGKDGQAEASLKSQRIALGRNYVKDFNFSFNNRDSSLNGVAECSEMASGAMSFPNSRVTLHADDSHARVGFSFDSRDDDIEKGEIYLAGALGRNSEGLLTVDGETLPSSIRYNGDTWSISPSTIGLVGKDIKINGLTASSGDQSLSIGGGYSSTANDTLSVVLRNFDMDLANRFVKGFGIEGTATGHALVTSPWEDNAGILLGLSCDSTKIAGERLGTLRLGSTIDENGKMNLTVRNDLDGVRTIDIRGDYFTRSDSVDLKAVFNRTNLAYAAPLLESVFSEMGGKLNGEAGIKGDLKNPSVYSEGLRLDDGMLTLAFTKVPYYASGPLHLDDGALFFDNVEIKDRASGTGTVNGNVSFKDLKNIRVDTRIKMNRMECLDTEEGDNPSFYGNVFATGDVEITGPLDAVFLNISAVTDRNGELHIPLSNASQNAQTDLLTFKEAETETFIDPYDLMMNNLTESAKKSSDLGVRLKVNATPGVQAILELDKDADNVLTGRGQGTLTIDVRPNRNLFSINGDYTISEGNFRFNAMNIAKRNFTITDGSSVRFNGEVMDSDLDIEGVYSTKAKIATLIADTSTVNTRRLVNCGISLTGKLREPVIGFSIDIPDLDPTTKGKVESALNTDDKIQKQLLALLISGSFIPDEQSGIVNNTSSNLLYSNVTEIMAGQLNSILEKLNIPLDLGLNYQTTDTGTSIFDVAVSTQLFNDRVLVAGAFGNREYSSSSTEDMAGDLDIEIKLDKPGQLRLTLFSHSADSYTTYLDNTQRNGVGITYQREFNTLKEFLKNLFTRKKKRSQTPQEMIPAEKEMKTISIE